jgi:hypothetical protein
MQKVNRKSTEVQIEPDSDAGGQKVLMAARVSKRFHERAQAECVRREVSLQKLMTEAVEAYIGRDPETPMHMLTLGRIEDDESKLSAEELRQQRSRQRLWSTYLNRMPTEKVETMVSAMKWDLQMKKSARRKGKGKRVTRAS